MTHATPTTRTLREVNAINATLRRLNAQDHGPCILTTKDDGTVIASGTGRACIRLRRA